MSGILKIESVRFTQVTWKLEWMNGRSEARALKRSLLPGNFGIKRDFEVNLPGSYLLQGAPGIR